MVDRTLTQDEAERAEAASVLDGEALERIRAMQRPGGPDLLRKLVNLYAESAPGLVTGMRDALSARDAVALYEAAHSLKSSSANLGAPGVAALCGELELMGRNGQLDDVAAPLEKLDREFQQVCVALCEEIRDAAHPGAHG